MNENEKKPIDEVVPGKRVFYEKKTRDFYYRNDHNGRYPLNYGAHVHYHVELLYMKEGNTTAFVNTDRYSVKSGDLLVMFSNQIHSYFDVVPHPKYELFILNPDIVPEFAETLSTCEPECSVIYGAKDHPRLASLLDILSTCNDFPLSSRETLMKGYLLSLFGEILNMVTLKETKNDENKTLRQLVSYCSQNFRKEISLAELEEQLHLSKYYISHLFSNRLGVNFNEYVNSLRISEACRLLRNTEMNITEVAYSSGFSTLRTFNRAFMRQMDISPSVYRRNSEGEIYGVSIPPADMLAQVEMKLKSEVGTHTDASPEKKADTADDKKS